MSPSQSKPQHPKQTIRRQTNGGVTPLPFGQQRMWFLQQLDPENPLYNTNRIRRVRGALNTGRPKGVELVHRHLGYYLDGIVERLKIPAGSSSATVSHITADLVNTILYLALATSGTCQLISGDWAADPAALRITGMDL